jgi:hypothetical protein
VQIFFVAAYGTDQTLEGTHHMKFDDRQPGKDSWRWKLLIAAALLSAFARRPDAAQLAGGIERLRTLRSGLLANYEMTLIRQFENPKHDFPQRIGYERKGNALLAWIEGTQDGKVRRLEFPYLRTSCGPA